MIGYLISVDGTSQNGNAVTIDESFSAIDDMKALEIGNSRLTQIVNREKIIMGRYSIKIPKKKGFLGFLSHEKVLIPGSTIKAPFQPPTTPGLGPHTRLVS